MGGTAGGGHHSGDRGIGGKAGRLWMDVIRLYRCNVCGHELPDKHREYMFDMVYQKVVNNSSSFASG